MDRDIAKLRWIQATVARTSKRSGRRRVFFISDEKYTRVQTATLEALIRKPIKELIEEARRRVFCRSTARRCHHEVIAGVSRDLRGRQLVAVKGHNEKLEVSRKFCRAV